MKYKGKFVKRLELQALKCEGLSDKALKVYLSSDPIDIYKSSDGTFIITGLTSHDGMTLEELNDVLEYYAEEE